MPKQALIMIDMQRGFLDNASPLCIPAAEGTVPACAALIDRCHEAGVPVIYAVRHYRSDGTDVEKRRRTAPRTCRTRFRLRSPSFRRTMCS